MKYIEVDVRTAIISHGFDAENRPIEERVNEQDYVKKVVSLKRILSVSEQYILVSAQDGREMYWEYLGTLQDIKDQLARMDVPVG